MLAAWKRYSPIVLGVGIFLLGVLSDRLFRSLSTNPVLLVIDDLMAGLSVGLLVFLYERRRQRDSERKLRVIREMNHHVRNALQVLSYSTWRQEDENLRSMMRDSVTHIDWALREVLPGETAGETVGPHTAP